ncbi:MAG: hypothetical protein K0Q72_583 [Armatimonadetes bacterium]|nr:hypothetical protein [Armatimonadota bacterium]
MDAKSGQGVPFATVGASTSSRERRNAYFSAWTYGDGTYSLRLPAGKWSITPGTADGYLPGVELPARELKEVERVGDVMLKLARRSAGQG